MTIITMLSDFGLSDGYVASMKGVILSSSPEIRIIDISHLIEKYDIISGAFTLASVVDYFPKGTIHLAVVDPGVGTGRRSIAISSSRCTFVGPDNGLLIPAALRTGILEVRSISEEKIEVGKASRTFHGRDIFAPVAAYLARQGTFGDIGPQIEDFIKLRLPKPTITQGMIIGQIIHRDSFGNLITNIEAEALGEINASSQVLIEFNERKMAIKIRPSYGYGEPGELLATVGGTGFLEISVNQGDASKHIGSGKGNEIRISAV
jgi:hypothetical protein